MACSVGLQQIMSAVVTEIMRPDLYMRLGACCYIFIPAWSMIAVRLGSFVLLLGQVARLLFIQLLVTDFSCAIRD